MFKKVGDAADKAGDKGGKFGKVLSGALKSGLAGVAVAAAGAGVAVGAFAVSAIRAASDGEQSAGAIQSVFGDAAKAVQKFADDSAMRLGLSQNAYRELASVVGSQLKNMGQSQDEAAVSSDKLISLGADLAATFGGSVSDAVGAVGSLLRGERDPIERYGVAIKDADIKARLAADGNDKLTGAALKTATAQATLKMLTEQAGGSLGAFGRESNTLAGVQERLRARVDDLKEAVGTRLLPIATKFAQYLLREGVPALERLVSKIDENKVEIGKFAVDVGKAVASITQGFLLFLQGTLTVLAKAAEGYSKFVGVVFAFARQILGAMEASLGWLPGYESKFRAAGVALDVYEKTVKGKISGASAAFQTGANVAGVAAGAVGNLKTKIDALSPKTVVAKANVGGADNVRQLESAINRLRSKTVSVTTVMRTITEGQRKVGRGSVPGFANGGILPRGMAVVGERGPELIQMPGARVFSNSDSKQMLGGGNTYNVVTTATDPVQLAFLLKRMEVLGA